MKRYNKYSRRINHLKLYKVNISKMMNVENLNAMHKTRPGIVLPFTPQRAYYGTTGYIVIPLSGSYNKKLENYKVELKSITKKGKSSYALVYNFGITTYESLHTWIYDNGKEIQILEDELEQVANMFLKLIEQGVRMTFADLQRKPYTETLLERLEERSKKIEQQMKAMEINNAFLKEGNDKFRTKVEKLEKNNLILVEDNKGLRRGNEELRKGNEELRKGNEELKEMGMRMEQMMKQLIESNQGK